MKMLNEFNWITDKLSNLKVSNPKIPSKILEILTDKNTVDAVDKINFLIDKKIIGINSLFKFFLNRNKFYPAIAEVILAHKKNISENNLNLIEHCYWNKKVEILNFLTTHFDLTKTKDDNWKTKLPLLFHDNLVFSKDNEWEMAYVLKKANLDFSKNNNNGINLDLFFFTMTFDKSNQLEISPVFNLSQKQREQKFFELMNLESFHNLQLSMLSLNRVIFKEQNLTQFHEIKDYLISEWEKQNISLQIETTPLKKSKVVL